MPRFRRAPRPGRRDPSERPTLVQERRAAPPVVEEEASTPPPPPPRPEIWPWLLLLLLLVVGGLLAAYFLTRDHDHKSKNGTTAAAVTVPRVVGMKQDAAVQRLNQAGLTPQIVAAKSTFSPGRVFKQDPGAGTQIARDSRVTISVSAVSITRVPNVVGTKTALAVQRLKGAGLGSQVTSVSARKPAGVVVAETPAAGASVAKGSTVALRVSKGQATVPDVVGQQAPDATAALRTAGLVPSTFRVPGSQPKGTVTAQQPTAGTKVPRGSKVRINVSTGAGAGGATTPTTTTTTSTTASGKVTAPNVVGLQQSAATRRLNTVGLRARVVYATSSKPSGQVIGQSPGAGTSVARGSRVRIAVSLGSGTTEVNVPDVVGQDQQSATTTLQSAGFVVQVIAVNTGDPSQDGNVIDEQPAGGTRAPQGSTVTIYVSRTS
jgi:beta-lactam-binding protein with PASTA domain